MNYLAHLCLSDGTPDSILGGFLGDFVKGRPEARFSEPVAREIRLHRAVDRYTDDHVAVRRALARLPARRRRFAPVAVDMAFDHFLAAGWRAADADDFAAARRRAYAVLWARAQDLPERLRRILPSLTGDDWLASYAELDGIALALARMARRLSRPNPLAHMAVDLRASYDGLRTDFDAFWPDACAFAQHERARRERGDRGA